MGFNNLIKSLTAKKDSKELKESINTQQDKINVFLDIETMGLNGYTDRITCIGFEVFENDKLITRQTFSNESEHSIVRLFLNELKILKSKSSEINIFTWNGDSFDIAFINVRALKYGIPIELYLTENNGFKFTDVKKCMPKIYFRGEMKYPSLDDAAKFFNFNIEKTAHGSEAPFMWKYKLFKELTEYCLNDVRILRKIAKRLKLF